MMRTPRVSEAWFPAHDVNERTVRFVLQRYVVVSR
jgi:hypothetical protein